MANANTPWGLAPVQYLSGNPWNGQARKYYIAAADTNAYAIGDPVASVAGGADANGTPRVTLATAGSGNALRGVIVSAGGPLVGGMSADPNNLNTTVIPATKTKAYYVMVVDDPAVVFELQEDSSGGALTVAAVGKNANLVAGANNGFVSGWQLQSSSPAAGATLQLKILQLSQRPDNAVGTNAKWLVKINNHEFSGGTAGV